jgi:glyoxylase-like metal-dependent hydrolase (beta-lactamase superfamily II)
MQITQNIHALKINFPSAVSENKTVERFVYVYFIFGKKICMIDAGVSAACPNILDYINSTGRSIAEVDLLIHTHCHPDHIGCSPAIKKASGCQVAAHEFAKPWIEDVDLQYRERPTGTFYTLVSGSVGVDRVLNDGDRLDLGEGQSLRVLHTPGHSRDSVSFFHEQDRVLFSGDTIPVPDERPVYEDVLALIASFRKMQSIKDLRVLCSSWLEPQYADDASGEMEKSVAYIQRLHEIVCRTKREFPAMDRAGLYSRILEIINQPKIPTVTKTIEAHLDASHIGNLLDL